MANWVTRFTVGEDYRWDMFLLPYDAEGSRAHAWGLTQIGILTADEYEAVDAALDAFITDALGGKIVVRPEDEDGHTVLEQYLTERLGTTGKKIHTGRSRNDQVLTAVRLYLRDRLTDLLQQTVSLAEALCDLAEQHRGWVLPGYTHLQRAMPSTVGLWAMGYAELLATDARTLREAQVHINTSPLGSAAGYGVPALPLPREAVAERLGFASLQTHVTAVQLSRGKLELGVVHALVQVAASINRLASDIVLYNTTEFGFVSLPPAFVTGSSIMPQKRNPDVLELARANYHRLLAEMNVLMTLPANLPSGYHRDLQLTKEAVMRSVMLAEDLLTAMVNVVPGLTFHKGNLEAAMSPELFATAHALDQVRQGVPFREAYKAAASEQEAWARLQQEQGLDVYTVEGFPGQINPARIRSMLAEV